MGVDHSHDVAMVQGLKGRDLPPESRGLAAVFGDLEGHLKALVILRQPDASARAHAEKALGSKGSDPGPRARRIGSVIGASHTKEDRESSGAMRAPNNRSLYGQCQRTPPPDRLGRL